MTDYKIEFEWNIEEYEGGIDGYPNKKQAEEIYHEAEKALCQACRDRGIELPNVAWLLVNEECEKCDNISDIIQ
jgi:hypothetical protein